MAIHQRSGDWFARRWFTGWSRREAVLTLGVATALVTIALDLADVVKLPAWVVVSLTALGGLCAIAVVVLTYYSDRSQSQRNWAELLELPPNRKKELPTVATVNPYTIGVSLSKHAERVEDYNDLSRSPPPYIARDVDRKLRELLVTKHFVLIVGNAKAGKTRTAFEAASAACRDAVLIVPKAEAGALTKVFAAEQVRAWGRRPLLVWLDDVDRYLSVAAGLDAALVQRLSRHMPKVTILGTVTRRRRADLTEAAENTGRMARQLFSQAEWVTLESVPSSNELDSAARIELYRGEDFRQGIGEQLVAAPMLAVKYGDGKEREPCGRALLDAAIDWRRTGVIRPVTELELRDLASPYLKLIRPNDVLDDRNLRAGLEWACMPIASHVALLERASDGPSPAYEPLDYIVECVEGSSPKILGETWEYVLTHVDPETALSVGNVAHTQRKLDVAARAFSLAEKSQRTDMALAATVNLGLVLKDDGDLTGATSALERVIASGNQDLSTVANFNLANILAEQGDIRGAKAAFERAIALPSGEMGNLAKPYAAINLGSLLTKNVILTVLRLPFSGPSTQVIGMQRQER
jgi:hypothetical protein